MLKVSRVKTRVSVANNRTLERNKKREALPRAFYLDRLTTAYLLRVAVQLSLPPVKVAV